MWTILGMFFKTALGTISGDLKDAYIAREGAKNDKERILADERIAVLEARKTTILAAQSDPVERWVRIGFALPFVLYTNKLVIYDKILGWGITDSLGTNLDLTMSIIISAYFLTEGVRRIFK